MHKNKLRIKKDKDVFIKVKGKEIKIGIIKDNAFRCRRNYARHLYRKLNSFNIAADVMLLNIDFIIMDIYPNTTGLDKHFGIRKSKIERLQNYYNTFVNFKNYERQIAIPLIVMDFKEGEKTTKGKRIHEFINISRDPHKSYVNWQERLVGENDNLYDFSKLKIGEN